MTPSRKRPDSSAEKAPRSAVEYRCVRGTVVTDCPATSVVIAALGPVLLRFVDPHPAQRSLGEMRLQARPECQRKGFRGRNPSTEPGNVRVQVAVIDLLDDLRRHQVRQPLQVHHIAGRGIDRATDDHLQDVIVPMEVDALAIEAAVFIRAQGRVPQLMSGIESLATADAHTEGSTHGACLVFVTSVAELQEFVAELLVRFVGTPPEGGPGGRLLLANPPHLHAKVGGVKVNRDAVGGENSIKRVDDLAPEPLLHREAASVEPDDPGELGKPDDALVRDVTDPGLAKERKGMMLADGVERD